LIESVRYTAVATNLEGCVMRFPEELG